MTEEINKQALKPALPASYLNSKELVSASIPKFQMKRFKFYLDWEGAIRQ